jgi:hypothetical protein
MTVCARVSAKGEIVRKTNNKAATTPQNSVLRGRRLEARPKPGHKKAGCGMMGQDDEDSESVAEVE